MQSEYQIMLHRNKGLILLAILVSTLAFPITLWRNKILDILQHLHGFNFHVVFWCACLSSHHTDEQPL